MGGGGETQRTITSPALGYKCAGFSRSDVNGCPVSSPKPQPDNYFSLKQTLNCSNESAG